MYRIDYRSCTVYEGEIIGCRTRNGDWYCGRLGWSGSGRTGYMCIESPIGEIDLRPAAEIWWIARSSEEIKTETNRVKARLLEIFVFFGLACFVSLMAAVLAVAGDTSFTPFLAAIGAISLCFVVRAALDENIS